MGQHNRMKRQVCIIVWMGVLLFGLDQPVAADGETASLTYPNEALASFIEVRILQDDFNEEETQQLINRLGAFPELMVAEAERQGGQLILTDGPITDVDEYAYLENRTPKGWENTGLTWRDVPGGGGETTVVRIGYTYRHDRHDVVNLEYHELSHGFDVLLMEDRISNEREFEAAFQEEKENLFPNSEQGNDYYDMREEYFAEAMAYYYEGGWHRWKLRLQAPKTYKFIDRLPFRLLYVDTENDVVQLNWEADKQVAVYEIYRDGEKIAETENASYKDTTLERAGSYQYAVVALDSSGEPLYETFAKRVEDAPAYTGPPMEEQEAEGESNKSTTRRGALGYLLGGVLYEIGMH